MTQPEDQQPEKSNQFGRGVVRIIFSKYFMPLLFIGGGALGGGYVAFDFELNILTGAIIGAAFGVIAWIAVWIAHWVT